MYWHFYGLPCVVALEKGIDWLFVSDSFPCWSFEFLRICGFSCWSFDCCSKKTAFSSETGTISTILAFEMVSHPAFKRQDRLGKDPFAGFGTVVEDITESGYTKNQPILLGAF